MFLKICNKRLVDLMCVNVLDNDHVKARDCRIYSDEVRSNDNLRWPFLYQLI